MTVRAELLSKTPRLRRNAFEPEIAQFIVLPRQKFGS
jgi:hypothetical protein